MDGVSGALTSASTELAQIQTNNAVGIKVLDKALETAGNEVLSLLQGLGKNIDVSA